jgi:hypothetical protein
MPPKRKIQVRFLLARPNLLKINQYIDFQKFIYRNNFYSPFTKTTKAPLRELYITNPSISNARIKMPFLY